MLRPLRVTVTAGGAAVAAALGLLAFAAPASAGPLRTGIVDPGFFASPNASTQALAFQRARQTGASIVRVSLFWNSIAPGSPAPGFEATNPADPGYDWAAFDREIVIARANGLDPIASIANAPGWATPDGTGIRRPNARAFGEFAQAAARRYSGSFVPPGGSVPLPRVRFWQAWNEPNRDLFLVPQIENGTVVSAIHYRAMLAEFYAGVKRVHASNLVVAGGLAPLGRPGKPAPLRFMRTLLCVSRTLARTCRLGANPARFDVWSHHPYTSGGPTHSALAADDVALGDLPEMKKLLRAAVRLGHVRSTARVQFWVTEFSWDTKPPDPRAVPAAVHARWTSEALYRMWQLGITVVVWFRIQDDPLSVSQYQSGFFTVAGARKRSLTAFRFPVVAFPRSTGVYVWGRTPTSRGASVVVEIKAGSRWRRLGTVRAGGSGIFQKTFRTPYRKGTVRARAVREVSLPFSLTPVRDRYVNPFGCGGVIRC